MKQIPVIAPVVLIVASNVAVSPPFYLVPPDRSSTTVLVGVSGDARRR